MNRKVKNATPVITSDGIQMKSKLEKRMYETLLSLGFKPKYESETFVYWKGKKPQTLFYDMSKDRRNHLNMKKLIDMKYTPDFIFMYGKVKVIIEVKGWENDNFSIRKKMFRSYLDSVNYPVVYAEIFTKRQLLEFLEELKLRYDDIVKQKENMIVRRKRNDCKAVLFDGSNISEVFDLFEVPYDESAQQKESDRFSREKMILITSPILGDFYVKKDQYVVVDTVTKLAFIMGQEQFEERYDIISE